MAILWSDYQQGLRIGIDVYGGSGSRTIVAYAESQPGYRQDFYTNVSFTGGWSGGNRFEMRTGGEVKRVELARTTARFTGTRNYGLNVQVPYGSFPTISFSRDVTISASENLPGAPRNVSASVSGDIGVVVSWGNQPGYANVRVYRSVNGGGFSQIAQLSGTATSYTDTNTSYSSSYAYQVRGLNSAGLSPVSSTSNTVHTRTIAPSGLSASRVNGNQIVLNWARNATYTGVAVYRKTGDDPNYQHIGTATGNAHTFTDTSTRGNSKYQYAVAGLSQGRPSVLSGASAVVYTLPNAPANVTARRSGNNIVVNADTIGLWGTRFSVYGSSGQLLASNQRLPWTYQNADINLIHRFQLVTELYDLRSPKSAWSNTIALAQPPAPPTIIEPETVTGTGVVTVRWTHNPLDASDQTAREIQRRRAGTSQWSTSTLNTRVESANFNLTAGVWEIRARTKGAHTSWGEYSPVHTFEVIDQPHVSIVSPGGNLDKSHLNVEWEYSQEQDKSQTGFRIIVVHLGRVVFDSDILQSYRTAYSVPGLVLENGETYTVELMAFHENVASTTQSVEVQVRFTPPLKPNVKGAWDDMNGANRLEIQSSDMATNFFKIVAVHADGKTRVIADQIVRSGASPIVVYDYEAVSKGETSYLISAVSAEALEITETLKVTADSCYCWLTSGAGAHKTFRSQYDYGLSVDVGRERTLNVYSGRALPVAYSAPNVHRNLEVSGTLYVGEGDDTPEKFTQVLQDSEPVFLWRDPDGRHIYCAPGRASFDRIGVDIYKWVLVVSEVDNA